MQISAKQLVALVFLIVISPFSFACEFSKVSFISDFEGARLNGCKQLSEHTFELSIDAENRPINPSPWYAFRIQSSAKQPINIVLNTLKARPRYLPKITFDERNWQALPFKVVKGQMQFSLLPDQQNSLVAGQEMLGNQDYIDWQSELVKQVPSLEKITLGQSAQGRPINALISQSKGQKEWIIVIGRQHPPELTGAYALQAFIESMFVSNANADFLNRFNIMLVANVNPDGVALGNWRHSSKGIDLNRDWNNFTQIETRLIRDKLLALLGDDGKLVFGLDFHSTQQDIFYTMPTDYHVAPSNLVEDWLTALKPNLVSSFVIRNRPGSSPGRGVFKQYIADEFNVHAVTYEMGDNTPKHMIDHVATEAAITFMQQMNKTKASDFYFDNSTSNKD